MSSFALLLTIKCCLPLISGIFHVDDILLGDVNWLVSAQCE